MFKRTAFVPLAALALVAALAGCSAQQAQTFQTTAVADANALNAVNTAAIQLTATVIQNQQQLAAALAQTWCPVANGAVSLGKLVAADPNAASKVQKMLQSAGPTGALAGDVCAFAGYGPTASTAAAPPAAVAPAVPASAAPPPPAPAPATTPTSS